MENIRVNNVRFDVVAAVEGGVSIMTADKLPRTVMVDIDGDRGPAQTEVLDTIFTTYGPRFLTAVLF